MEVPKELTVAIELAERTAAEGGSEAICAQEMVRLLGRVREQIAAEGERRGLSRVARRGQGEVEYIVEGSGPTETLTEHRLSGKSYPFRCPKGVYEAVVAVLAASERPMSVEDIATAVEKVMGVRPAEYQLRVPLRLWMAVEPLLVPRVRARYRPADPISFHAQALVLWNSFRRK